MAPAAALSVMSSTVTTGFATLADFHMPNTGGGAAYAPLRNAAERQLYGAGSSKSGQRQRAPWSSALWGISYCRPIREHRRQLLGADRLRRSLELDHIQSQHRKQCCGQIQYDGPQSACFPHGLLLRNQWMQEKGIGVTQFYSEFDMHTWRQRRCRQDDTERELSSLVVWHERSINARNGWIHYISGGAQVSW